MRVIDWSGLDEKARRRALARPPRRRNPEVQAIVRRIFNDVEAGGESAVRRWAEKFDGHPPRKLELTAKTVARARSALEKKDLQALEFAASNIRRYHQDDRPREQRLRGARGVICRRVWRPLQCAGLYVPGGTAPLFSTLLMLAIPAASAGVAERITVTPPPRDGALPPMMIAAAAVSGLNSLWLVGGAQAIAALAFGAGLPRAGKIFGPGNVYVAEAKRRAAALPGGPAIDLPAGPSELMVIADDTADPETVAADLLSQAEHDAAAHVLLVTTSRGLARAVAEALTRQVATLPRKAIAQLALNTARTFVVSSITTAIDIANRYAPEHLSLQFRDAEAWLPAIARAGAVFLGPWAAESFGDYVCGPSHVLPTDGAAGAFSGVSVSSFMTSFVVQEMDGAGARLLAGSAARLARLEGLEAHARAAALRAATA